MDVFAFKIVWRKSNVWRGFYAMHEAHKLKVRHFKNSGWHLFIDGRQKSGSPHPLGFAILLRYAEELFINKRTVGDALRIAEESIGNGQTGAHGPEVSEATPGLGAGAGGVASIDG